MVKKTYFCINCKNPIETGKEFVGAGYYYCQDCYSKPHPTIEVVETEKIINEAFPTDSEKLAHLILISHRQEKYQKSIRNMIIGYLIGSIIVGIIFLILNNQLLIRLELIY